MRAAEFFAGMGLMRAGLNTAGIETVFANDIDETKAALYRDNWGGDQLTVGDIRSLAGDDVPDIDLATASFPCVDLSLAGNRRGLDGEHSGLVRDFLRILGEMGDRSPSTVMIENVVGFLTANGGEDFDAVRFGLHDLGYSTDHIVVDASAFVAQSRARVFLIGNRGDMVLPDPPPIRDDLRLSEVAERDGDWWPPARLARFLLSLSPVQEERVSGYQTRPETSFFGAFRRTRNGSAVWEVRDDERAGALRTTGGGSSKQALLRAGRGCLAARWMSVLEYARLQGAENLRYDAVTPQQGMFALGDAVCVPVVEWLAHNCLVPLLKR
ncbi:MAG: DNA cytosine methyltransferase [Chloroflexi bacterium]|nr:DNA cytosine methyltransferase [Chloroflexota bacterium]